MIEYLQEGVIINNISDYILPLLVFIIIIYGFIKKVDVYDKFIEGAKESFDLIFTLFPPFLAMIFGVNIFLKSGIIEFIYNIFSGLKVIPSEILPMILLRPISGSASLATLNNIYNIKGPDSISGLMASIIQGSTDTTFYVITLYFGSIGIKKIRYAMYAGLFADLVGIISAILVVKLFF